MALTDAKIRAAKPTDKAYKLTDGAGMFLLVHPNGSRYWRLRYRILGKEKTLALGVYPEVSLSEARTKRDEARKLISEGIDPCEQKRAKKVVPDLQLSFEHIARRWHASNKQWAQSHSDKVLKSLETHVFPLYRQPGYHNTQYPGSAYPCSMLQKLNKFMKSPVVCSKEYLP